MINQDKIILLILQIFTKIVTINLASFYSKNLWKYIEKLELGAILQR